MKIVVDENIPYGREAFASLGDVVLRPGRVISNDDVRDADLLLVRSITKVNAALLDNSRVRFVATATIGVDHLDEAYLRERGIVYASAPGCNANSVAEYITAALLVLGESRGFQVAERTLGIIGHGNVGKRVEQKARALGMDVVINDPPLARATGDAKYRPIEEVLACPIITVHVPLTKTGPDATFHLLNDVFFQRCKTGAIILNTARGSVVHGTALRDALESGKLGAAVLDVWEGEPNVDVELLANCALATPHIAGYSFDGKVNGTRQIYEAACAFLGCTPTWDPTPLLPAPDVPEVTVNGTTSLQAALAEVVLRVYDIREDDARMRALLTLPEGERGGYFDRLRKEYPRRREFQNTRATLTVPNESFAAVLNGLGFRR
ncbi:MAG TPA: 4-phosphoerythronate dehydrogenase PdxB [Candidatus Hydrogenedentes bacterium]|nr:4-phosphoerythronate dehydrogenase PdxB [Candidatus Hydrogenedentota bacterium]